jgi:hypothetical protein
MSRRRRIVRFLLALLALGVLDWAAATYLMWSAYGNVAALLCDPGQLSGQHVSLTVTRAGEKPRTLLNLELLARANADGLRLVLDHDGYVAELISTPDGTRVVALKGKACFAAAASDLAEARGALAELGDTMSRALLWQRIGLSLLPHPLLVKPWPVRAQGTLCWRVALAGGHADIALSDGLPREVEVQGWRATLQRSPLADQQSPVREELDVQRVESAELDKSLAAVLHVVALQFKDVPREANTTRHEGNGALTIKDGWRVLRVRGKPYDIGFQHGRLLAPNIKRL